MLKRTQDRKTANLPTPNGKQSKIGNAFSLPAGTDFSCPFATNFCDSICYAGKLERIYRGFKAVVMHNFDLLNASTDMTNDLSVMIQAFVDECDKARAKGLNAPKLFRIHADGDFFSPEYATAWKNTIKAFPDVHFWAYTRVPFAVEILHGIENLSMYFSADPDNIQLAKIMIKKGVKIAYVDDTFADAQNALNELGIKAVRCPSQNNKDFDLINERGSACVRCGLCVFERGNVVFSAKGR